MISIVTMLWSVNWLSLNCLTMFIRSLVFKAVLSVVSVFSASWVMCCLLFS